MEEFFEGDFGGIATGGLEEGAVGGAEVDGFLRVFAGEETEGESGGESVAAADAVFEDEPLKGRTVVERIGLGPVEDGGPVVFTGGDDFAEGGADDFEIGIILGDLADHVFIIFDGQLAAALDVRALDLVAEHFFKVFFVADEAVDVLDEWLGGGDGFGGGPELCPEVQVVGDDGAGVMGGLEGGGGDLSGGLGEAGKDAAGVEPADAALGEEVFPVDITGLHFAGGGVAAVVEGDGGTGADADLGPVEPDAGVTSDAVVFHFRAMADIHADAASVIFDDGGDGIVDESADPSGAEAESCEGVGDIELTAADVDVHFFGKFDAAVPFGAEADHAFTE